MAALGRLQASYGSNPAERSGSLLEADLAVGEDSATTRDYAPRVNPQGVWSKLLCVRVPIPQIDDELLVTRRVFVEARQVAFIKGILEASEGLACLFAERGGELLLVAPLTREAELDELVRDLQEDLGAIVSP